MVVSPARRSRDKILYGKALTLSGVGDEVLGGDAFVRLEPDSRS